MVPLDPAGRVSVSELTTSLEGAILTEGKSQAGTLLVTLSVATSNSHFCTIPTHTYKISYSLPPLLSCFSSSSVTYFSLHYEHTFQSDVSLC